MRVTFNTIQHTLDSVDTAASQLQAAQQQVSTGKRISAPSDDPSAMQSAINLRGDMAGLDAYTKASDTADAHLSALDTTLGDIVDKLTQAITTATGAHGDTASQASRDAARETVLGIRDAIQTDINGKFGGVYLFSGTRSNIAPYSNATGTWTYGGSTTPMTVEIAPGRSVSFTMDGSQILDNPGGGNVLTALESLAGSIQSGDNTAIAAGIDQLQQAFVRATRAQSQVGSDEATVTDAKARISDLHLADATRLSTAEDANLAEAITRMGQADTAYRAALGATAAAQKTSLLDYL